MDAMSVKFLSAAIAMVGSLGSGVGLGILFGAWVLALARNPSGEAKFKQIGLLGFAATELVLLMCFTVSMLFLFAFK